MTALTQDDLIRCAAAADALRQAEARYWRARAEQFEWAKPRVDDFHGQTTTAELSARWNRLHQMREACLNKAALLEGVAA